MKMKKHDLQVLKIGEGSEAARKTPHILQPGSIREYLERRSGDPMHYQVGECSLSFAQWEAQWQEFLRTVENPHSGWGIPQLPEKPSHWEDAKAFLASFEQVAKACQWPQEEWMTRLRPALNGEAEKAFKGLAARDREDYGKVPLEEASGSVSQASQDLCDSEQMQLRVETKEEQDGDTHLMAGDADGFGEQHHLSEKDRNEELKGRFRDHDQPQRQEGSHIVDRRASCPGLLPILLDAVQI
uniref:Uncharacterized protein n=1 Tax=Sphaerodactylus townsendi TaxID=933632 RepID=A0ACB8EFP0_9SAUR